MSTQQSNKMYIPQHLQVGKDQLDSEITNSHDDYATLIELLVKADHFYHCNENSYDGGLSMLDRINAKLKRVQSVQRMKDNIRNSLNPEYEFMASIESMLPTVSDIAYYGL